MSCCSLILTPTQSAFNLYFYQKRFSTSKHVDVFSVQEKVYRNLKNENILLEFIYIQNEVVDSEIRIPLQSPLVKLSHSQYMFCILSTIHSYMVKPSLFIKLQG